MPNPVDALLPHEQDHARAIAAHVLELMRTERPVVAEWLDQDDAAIFLGVSDRFLEGRRYTKTGPAYVKHRERCVRYHVDDLRSFMASGRVVT